MKLNDGVYYTPPDPTGTSLTLVDADGNLAGRLLYDAYGSVLTGTLAPDLEMALTGQIRSTDPDAGLAYLGDGRWYAPALGRPLQPNPVGGPPSVPQALNRYAATPLGAPGVAEGIVASGLVSSCLTNRLCNEIITGVAGVGADKTTDFTFEALSAVHWKWRGVARFGQTIEHIEVLKRSQPIYEVDFEFILPTTTHDQIPIGIRKINGNVGQEIIEQRVIRKIDPTFGAKLGREVLDNTLPFAVDFGFQWYQDWGNPYLTPTDKFGRSIISGFVGLGGGGIAYGIAWVVVGGTSPPGWVLLGTGFIIGIFVENPISTAINDAVFPEQRNLAPLE